MEAKFEASNVDELDVQTSRLVDLVDTLPVWQQFSAGRSSTLQTLLNGSSFGQQDSCRMIVALKGGYTNRRRPNW